MMMIPQEIIRKKRDAGILTRDEIDFWVKGITDESLTEGQVAAMAMAICWHGMSRDEVTHLTHAMAHSGFVLEWKKHQLHGPVLDKHSTGGVGDKVSLILAPIVAACGGYVPMLSGRGLGHTGGTLDKMESIPGYKTALMPNEMVDVVKKVGCAVVGQSSFLAPADRRFYAIRDVTGTVESMALMTASILSKKCAAGLDALVMDVKTGNGAFFDHPRDGIALAEHLVQVGNTLGLRTSALLTDMNQVLGKSAGNALEVIESIEFMKNPDHHSDLGVVTESLCAEMLVLGQLATDHNSALSKVQQALDSGKALEKFSMMVHELGGPTDFVQRYTSYLDTAPIQYHVLSPRDGWIVGMNTRQMGLFVIELGGGRRKASDHIDHAVGFDQVVKCGTFVNRGDVLAIIHARSQDQAETLAQSWLPTLTFSDQPEPNPQPFIHQRISEKVQ